MTTHSGCDVMTNPERLLELALTGDERTMESAITQMRTRAKGAGTSYRFRRSRAHAGGQADIMGLVRNADSSLSWRPERHLPMSVRGRRKSPTGFEWGYGGSGPAATADAILTNALALPLTEFETDAVRSTWQELWQDFKWACVARRREDEWTIDRENVAEWVIRWLRARRGQTERPGGVYPDR